MKTKPTQHSVKELRGLGIQPDMIVVVRSEFPMTEDLRDKIALFCDIDEKSVINAKDEETIYELVMSLQAQDMDDLVLENLNIEATGEAQLDDWKHLLDNLSKIDKTIKIGLVGKYGASGCFTCQLLNHFATQVMKYTLIDIHWINSQDVTPQNYKEILSEVDGIVVPGGFGDRGIEGKILTLNYARRKSAGTWDLSRYAACNS